ncbi:hypothetical protein C0991_011593 [Blastosporella zonata]|nr:hypothetical protein C0991_011593 [Blastosporella zonata]
MAARKGGKQPIPPGLSTCPQNKVTHPARKAGVAPIRRRPHEEIARDKEKIAHEKQQKIQRDAQARVKAAQIKDRLHQEDLDCKIHGNYPAHTEVMPFKPLMATRQDSTEESELAIDLETCDKDIELQKK